MKTINIKNALFLLVSLSFLAFWVIALLKGSEMTFVELAKLIPQVVSVDSIAIYLFSSFMWKWGIFRDWLVPFPDLSGTWKGHIHSTWVDPVTGNRPAPIPAILTIKQSFLKMSCVMRTGEMTSRSCTADFVIDKENQLVRLCYTYDSNPLQTVRDRSPQHCGTMLFDIIGKKETTLLGEYWTGRKTTGNVEMSFWKKKLLDRYPSELGDHPVSAIRNGQS